MPNFSPYLGIAAAITIGIFVGLFSNTVAVPHALTLASPTASSTPAPATTSMPLPASSMVATPTAPKPVVIGTASSSPHIEPLQDAAILLRKALVNIMCVAPTGSRSRRIISGSGVFIDAKGIILTNAHIGEYFLLADHDVSCVIRSGGPAIDRYKAALIFISPAWLRANPDVLIETAPTGTGEYDFALLAVTKSATTTPLPASFPSLPLAETPTRAGTPIAIASYGAQFLDQQQLKSALFPTVVFGSVKEVLTFVVNTIDVLVLGGSPAAQEGSSGGGVTGVSGKLLGTITTSTVEGDTALRSLDAITASYIRAEYMSETGQTLDQFLAQPTAASVANFAPQIPALEAIITANLH